MKKVTIEALVRWAVTEEWPKANDGGGPGRRIGSAWGPVASYAALLTVIDENRYGVVPDLSASGDPHPDALAVADALARLGAAAIGEIDPDVLVGDLVYRVSVDGGDEAARAARTWALGRAASALDGVTLRGRDGALRAREPLDVVVVHAAILGAPEWRSEGITWGPARRSNGSAIWRRRLRRPVAWDRDGVPLAWEETEVDAPSVNGRRPGDAYPVEEMSPDPMGLLRSRAQFVVWATALRAVAEEVSGRLTAHMLVGDVVSAPWLFGGVRNRILSVEDGRVEVEEKTLKKFRRKA